MSNVHLYLFLHLGQAIDSPLSETGLQQAEAAGRYLTDVTFSNVFSSDMLRAQQVRCGEASHGEQSLNVKMKSVAVYIYYCTLLYYI